MFLGGLRRRPFPNTPRVPSRNPRSQRNVFSWDKRATARERQTEEAGRQAERKEGAQGDINQPATECFSCLGASFTVGGVRCRHAGQGRPKGSADIRCPQRCGVLLAREKAPRLRLRICRLLQGFRRSGAPSSRAGRHDHGSGHHIESIHAVTSYTGPRSFYCC